MEVLNICIIWKRIYNPFLLGGNTYYNIKTEIIGFPVIELGKGFKGVFIDKNGIAGVYEYESGGLVGNTIQEVINDIESCNDIGLMKKTNRRSKERIGNCKRSF